MKNSCSTQGVSGGVSVGSRPFAFELGVSPDLLRAFDTHLQRRLSALPGLFNAEHAYAQMVLSDPLVYEVYEKRRPEVAGELLHGITILHPGRVGDEFFMTKGHHHAVRETAEIYYCLDGSGFLLMETEEGDWAAEEFSPRRMVYAPPCWAHRSINTGTDDLVVFFAVPGHSGHDYGTIEQRGFRKIVILRNGCVEVVDNPRWSAAVAR
jgi:glucose-6-phosphate isomerase